MGWRLVNDEAVLTPVTMQYRQPLRVDIIPIKINYSVIEPFGQVESQCSHDFDLRGSSQRLDTTRVVIHPATIAITQRRASLAMAAAEGEKSIK